VVFLEPSCYSMFVDEYRQLGLPGAEAVAGRCVLLEDLLLELLDADPGSVALDGSGIDVAVHVHCHAKALGDPERPAALLERLPGAVVRRLDTGCCGMAGAFGLEGVTRAVSRAVAEPLLAALAGLGPEVEVVASGASCRHQIAALSPRRARHLAEILLLALRTEAVADPEN
jgi:Fe-S oxidoreductase